MPDLRRAVLVGTAALVLAASPLAAQGQQKPNVLVVWGDDIGQSNISAYDWRHPSGPDSSIEGRDNYPVVNVVGAPSQVMLRTTFTL